MTLSPLTFYSYTDFITAVIHIDLGIQHTQTHTHHGKCQTYLVYATHKPSIHLSMRVVNYIISNKTKNKEEEEQHTGKMNIASTPRS